MVWKDKKMTDDRLLHSSTRLPGLHWRKPWTNNVELELENRKHT